MFRKFVAAFALVTFLLPSAAQAVLILEGEYDNLIINTTEVVTQPDYGNTRASKVIVDPFPTPTPPVIDITASEILLPGPNSQITDNFIRTRGIDTGEGSRFTATDGDVRLYNSGGLPVYGTFSGRNVDIRAEAEVIIDASNVHGSLSITATTGLDRHDIIITNAQNLNLTDGLNLLGEDILFEFTDGSPPELASLGIVGPLELTVSGQPVITDGGARPGEEKIFGRSRITASFGSIGLSHRIADRFGDQRGVIFRSIAPPVVVPSPAAWPLFLAGFFAARVQGPETTPGSLSPFPARAKAECCRASWAGFRPACLSASPRRGRDGGACGEA